MTDGIIQEVFKKWIFTHPKIKETAIQELESLQQELIKKIIHHHFDNDEYFNYEIKSQLVGDSIDD